MVKKSDSFIRPREFVTMLTKFYPERIPSNSKHHKQFLASGLFLSGFRNKILYSSLRNKRLRLNFLPFGHTDYHIPKFGNTGIPIILFQILIT